MQEKKGIRETVVIQEKILAGDDYLKELLIEINQATKAIDLETYIYAPDYFGETIASALINAVERGVKVRVLVDGVGTPFFHKNLLELESHGVLVRVYHPSPYNWFQFKRAKYPFNFFSKLLYFLAKFNLRNHRKICIVDNRIVFIGSFNIDINHLSPKLGGQGWHDLAIKIENADLANLQFAFNLCWEGCPVNTILTPSKLKKIQLRSIFRLNYTWQLRRKLYKNFLKKLKEASHRIWLISPYFNPDYLTLKRLLSAAKRGVDVRIILPAKSDIAIMKIVAATFYMRLIKSGIKIYEYLPAVLHAKVLIIDNWFSLGSSNLNQRSLRHDFEVDVTIQTEASKKILEQQFLKDLNFSRKVTIDDINNIPWYKKMSGYILMFMKIFL